MDLLEMVKVLIQENTFIYISYIIIIYKLKE